MSVKTSNLPAATTFAELLGHEDQGGGEMATKRLSLAWASYTPVLTSATGTLGTYTVNRARYVRVGWHVTVFFDVSITSAGTAPGGDVIMTLPVAPAAVAYCGAVSGREQATGGLIAGPVDGANARARLSLDAGAFAGSNGNRLIGAMAYEAA